MDLQKHIKDLEAGLVQLQNMVQQQRGALGFARRLQAEQTQAAAQAAQLAAAAPLPTLPGGWLSEDPPVEPGGQPTDPPTDDEPGDGQIGAPDANG